jgi:arsenate reductase
VNDVKTGADEILTRISSALAARYTGIFSAETVDRYVHESYVALYRTATIKTYVPTLTERFAADRLTALAQSRGAVAKPVPEVLFICVHNAGRSQMAAALLDRAAAGRVHVRSAGSIPADQINPAVIESMTEVGLDLTAEFPKPLTDDVVRAADVVITMGCGDACPVYPGKRYLDWDLPDPAGQDLETVRAIRDQIDAHVHDLLDDILTPV